MKTVTKEIATHLIDPNPWQHRVPTPERVRSIADSIKEKGLIQAIVVRPSAKTKGRFEIVVGETRWRSHILLEMPTIRCEVRACADDDMEVLALIENLQRQDPNPIEEANAYQRLLNRGYTPAAIAKELKYPGTDRVTARLNLLKLENGVQALVAAGQITPSMGSAISWAPKDQHTRLVREVGSGKLGTVEQVRHAAIALRGAADQPDAFAMAPVASTKDIRALHGLEAQIERVKKLVLEGFADGECIAAKRVDPGRVAKCADELALIRKHVLQMEHALRCAAAQGSMLLQSQGGGAVVSFIPKRQMMAAE
jgi:ParB family chromosome partitioning protein